MPPTSNPSSTSSKSCKHTADEAAAPPNAKRARLDVGSVEAGGQDVTNMSSDESNNLKKHLGKLYHLDGNVVLVAEKVAFRVHRTFLAGHSEVFKNMFELATHPKDGECFDGCSAIHLDDKVDDLIIFLETLYGYIAIQEIEPDLPKISAVLRLSTKYIVDTLRSSCLWHLSLEKVPTTLDAYDKHYNNRDESRFHFSYYNLVYEIGATRLLPASFYIINTVNTSSIHQTDLNLPGDVMVRLYQGRTDLFDEYNQVLDGLKDYLTLYYHQYDCCDMCHPKQASIIANMVDGLTQPSLLKQFDPLRYLYDVRENNCSGLCSTCLPIFRSVLDYDRRRIWNSLPKIFKFGNSWADLKSH